MIFKVEKYEIKKTRYPNSYYDVFELWLFGFKVFYFEKHNASKYY